MATRDSKKLTADQIKTFRLELLKAYQEGSNQAEEQFQRGKLSQTQFVDAVEELQKLKLQSTKLLALLMSMELNGLLETNSDSPATRISKATDRLNLAARQIENFMEFLQSIADVIRITSGIIVAMQTGMVAKIR
jgi:hypothetical protein